jgi:hypothetical protein
MFNNIVQGWINYCGPLLQVHAVSTPQAPESCLGAVGVSEIQTAQTPRTQSRELVGRGLLVEHPACLRIGGWGSVLVAGQWEQAERFKHGSARGRG